MANEKALEVKLLENPEDIAKVKRLVNRVAFSIFFRRRNVEQHKHELKAVEKIKRFLESESNESYAKSSKLWISMGQTIAQHIHQINQVIDEAKDKDEVEVAFLESIKEHTYGDDNYDHDYFTAILPYADVNGDTDEFNTTLKAMMRESGFIPKEENVVNGVDEEPKEVEKNEEDEEHTSHGEIAIENVKQENKEQS